MIHLEAAVDEVTVLNPGALIILAGDFNNLPDQDILARTGLQSIVKHPTRGESSLDRIYVSDPVYKNVKIVKSAVKSDHMAVIASGHSICVSLTKTRTKIKHRKVTPSQHAALLSHISKSAAIDVSQYKTMQRAFDALYAQANSLLDQYYPEKVVTISSTDPPYVTPKIKLLLRQKNRLLRLGRIEEAGAISDRIGKAIIKFNSTQLRNKEQTFDPREMWEKVKQLTRKAPLCDPPEGISADTLNAHYAKVSSDNQYVAPVLKDTAAPCEETSPFTEQNVFYLLDRIKPTTTGYDGLPAWFLRTAAPYLAAPIAYCFNISLESSEVPQQWKTSIILPIAKIHPPAHEADFRPISITPILSRLFERFLTRTQLP